MRQWFIMSCVAGTAVLACILPALAVLCFVGVAAFLLQTKK